MGCCYCYSRETNTPYPLEDLITRAELLLNFHKYQSKELDRIFYRHSYNKHMTKLQLSQALNDLGISLSSKPAKHFYYNFYDNTKKLFCSRQLSTLGVLLGSGEKSAKLKLLFENYDNDSNRILNKKELQLMFHDISQISCKYLLDYTIHISDYTCKEALKDYQIELMNMKASIINNFVNSILKKQLNKSIHLEAFLSEIKEEKAVCIINPRMFRKKTQKLWLNIEKAVKVANYSNDKTRKNSKFYDIVQLTDIDRHPEPENRLNNSKYE